LADEKVLDVPAIDMTDAGLAKKRPRSKSAARPARPAARKRDGSVGRATYDAINTMVAGGAMTKQAAFASYGKKTRAQPGTVSANYYRVARAKAAEPPSRRSTTTPSRRQVGSTQQRRRGRPAVQAANLDAAMSALVASVQDLALALKRKESETAELRQKLDGLQLLP
jgi:hypothetical protein